MFHVGDISARFIFIFYQGYFFKIFHFGDVSVRFFHSGMFLQMFIAGDVSKRLFLVSDVSARFSVLKLLFTRNPFGLVETHVCSELSSFFSVGKAATVLFFFLLLSLCLSVHVSSSPLQWLSICVFAQSSTVLFWRKLLLGQTHAHRCSKARLRLLNNPNE